MSFFWLIFASSYVVTELITSCALHLQISSADF